MKPLIVGLGNRFRTDDSVGPYIVDSLASTHQNDVDLMVNCGDAAALLDSWKTRHQVLLIDACYDETSPAGYIHQLDGLKETLTLDNPSASSHALTLSNAIELGKLLNTLPRSLRIYSIVGQNFAHGEGLTAEVLAAAQQLIKTLSHQINTGKFTCMSNH
jgi:hydrogenase maturation protease